MCINNHAAEAKNGTRATAVLWYDHGYLNTKKIVDIAEKNNIKSIITTTLESEIGFLANVHIAAALNIKEYCGFSTWNLFFKNPLLKGLDMP